MQTGQGALTPPGRAACQLATVPLTVTFPAIRARHWGTPRYLDLDCPHLTADAVDALVAANIALAGIDSLNIDDPADPARPAHQRLLGADIPIVEHLTNLGSVPDGGARLTVLPAPVRAMASFPVRAVAVHPG